MAVRHPITPVRQHGHKRLTPIPIDIYMLILDELLNDSEEMPVIARKAILANLNLVCRLFCTLSTPKLFALVAFRGTADKESERKKQTLRTAWLKRLVGGDEAACLLGTFVRKLEFHDWISAEDARSPFPDFTKHLQVLPRFPNLKSLSLTRTPITEALFRAVASFGKLDSLCIQQCSFCPSDPPPRLSVPILPCLTSFEVTVVEDADPYLSPLASLAKTSSLRSLKTTEWLIARAIMESGVDAPLQHLDVPFVSEDAAILVAYLDRTPTISELSISREITDGNEQTLPFFCVIARRVITASAAFALSDSSAADIPPETTNIADEYSRRKRLDLPSVFMNDRLARSIRNLDLRELEIPAFILHRYAVDQFAPRLAKLAVCFPIITFSLPLDMIIREMCAQTQRLPLRRLELHFLDVVWKLNLPLQHQMIMRYLARAFPTAESFSLIESVDWQRKADGSGWRPLILERESVKALLELEQLAIWDVMEVEDFDGALAALFAKGEMTPVIRKRLSLRSR